MTGSPAATTLVGMCNPHSADPADALSPERGGSAGHRLWAMLDERYGLTREEYLRGFPRRVNLCPTLWNKFEGDKAADLILSSAKVGDRFVLLGAQVAHAFGVSREPLYEWFYETPPGENAVLVLKIPHPSGLCRDYNDPEVRHKVAGLLHTELLRNLGLDIRGNESC